jgi:glycosyltransferase involved in cell wall biosynthesis
MSVTTPLVTIITPCLNRADFIEASIRSLAEQNYPNLQHIVIDGGSTDGTLEILQRHQGHLYWESTPGLGQAAALNRALELTRGEIVGWLNSDDIYLPGAVSRAVKILTSRPELDLFYGTCLFIDNEGDPIGTHSTKAFNVSRLVWYEPGYFTIQSMFFRRRVIDRVGGFDTSLRYALDYDWFIRIGKTCRVAYVPECLGAFRRHDAATQGRQHRTAYFKEVVDVSRRHGGNRFTPIKYQLMVRVPAATALMRWLVPVKRVLVRAGLVPAWL